MDINKTKERENYSNNYLKEYLVNKKRINYIANLFDILNSSDAYCLVEFDEPPVERIKDNMISYDYVPLNFYKKRRLHYDFHR